MLFGLVFLISVAVVLKFPDLSGLVISYLTALLKHLEIYTRFDPLAFRFPDEFLQNLSGQFLPKGEWSSIEIKPRSIPFVPRFKYALMVASVDVSVIVPTWNEEKYLQRCLKSLVNQSYRRRYEVIVVDGGSTDQTAAIAEKYADEVLVENCHPAGAARNKGAEIAKGDVLAFIDADTVASDQWLQEIVRFFRSNPGAVGVTGPTLPYDGGPIDSITYRFWTIYLQKFLLSLGMPHVIGFNCAYRRESFLMAGGFDETAVMSEDILLAQKMRRFGKIVFDKRMFALTSARRFQRCGHAYITGLYLLNGFSTLLLKKSSRNYPPIR
jgi:glycosyltransferase involved in cell wall biosynthesis